ncbi:MAG: hypothetical protein R3A13_09095 [Bdellovibrionota bacterium]
MHALGIDNSGSRNGYLFAQGVIAAITLPEKWPVAGDPSYVTWEPLHKVTAIKFKTLLDAQLAFYQSLLDPEITTKLTNNYSRNLNFLSILLAQSLNSPSFKQTTQTPDSVNFTLGLEQFTPAIFNPNANVAPDLTPVYCDLPNTDTIKAVLTPILRRAIGIDIDYTNAAQADINEGSTTFKSTPSPDVLNFNAEHLERIKLCSIVPA